VPGTADYKTGLVEYCPNLGWEDVPAGEIFKKNLGVDVSISQDSRLAAWAEYLLGAGRGFNSIICVTVGTGIGCGIVLDGKIFHGSMNTAGELGHSVFEKDGRPCNCGNHGCLERYSSGTGVFDRAFEAYPDKFVDRPHKSETVFELAYAGDQDMLGLIRRIVEDLAVGIANAVSILSPEAVIISGGLCEHDELVVKPLKELVDKYGYYSWVRKKQLKIEKAQMGPEAPMVGAALFYKAL
jgi:glucokinase